MDAETIANLIQTGLPDAHVQVQGDDGVHFEATVVSAAFAGKLPLARHRLVYAALGTMMQTDIHALSITATAPNEADETR